MVKTNDLKKGTRVMLRNGWEADIMDNMRGNTRVCMVYGFETEAGSVYSHDIMAYKDKYGNWQTSIKYTKSQIALKNLVSSSRLPQRGW